MAPAFRRGIANKIRFMSPVPVGAKLRMGVTLINVVDIAGGGSTTGVARLVAGVLEVRPGRPYQ